MKLRGADKLGRARFTISWLWLLVLALCARPAHALPTYAKWSARLEPRDARAGESAQVVLTTVINAPWHVYSTTQLDGGPLKTTITLQPGGALSTVGKATQPLPIRVHDAGFNMEVEFYRGAVAFGLPVHLAAGASGQQHAAVKVRSMLCKDTTCLAPTTVTLPVTYTVAAGQVRQERLAAINTVPPQPPGAQSGAAKPPGLTAVAPASSASDGGVAHQVQTAQTRGIIPFLWLSLSAGFLALLTPCVFPMIPITVSFFAKQQEDAGASRIAGPAAYCLGIVSTFTGLGLLVSAIFGATGITAFAANPRLNVAMAALFAALALNLFGAYEIVVPSGLLNRIQLQTRPGGATAGRTRFLVPLCMGLAFTLTSFTCTVPFVGTLLVATAHGSLLWPLLGMLAFSIAFASPFFLLALFPQWLARLPKAGGWLVSVKAFMGFLELAAAMKFLSNADYSWQLGWLTRPVFLSVWSSLALLASLYLLCWVPLPHDSGARPGPFRRALGVAMGGLSIYLLAAIGGASLGEFDAYLPPRDYGFGPTLIAGTAGAAVSWIKDDYERALAQAKTANQPMLINFTGFACTNCRLMEEHVLSRLEVAAEIANFIPVELHVDGPDTTSQRNLKLLQDQFKTVSIPTYVVVSPTGQELARLEGLNRDPQAFIAFLKSSQTSRLVQR